MEHAPAEMPRKQSEEISLAELPGFPEEKELSRRIIADLILLRDGEERGEDQMRKGLEQRVIEHVLYLVALAEEGETSPAQFSGLRGAARYFEGREMIYPAAPEMVEVLEGKLEQVREEMAELSQTQEDGR